MEVHIGKNKKKPTISVSKIQLKFNYLDKKIIPPSSVFLPLDSFQTKYPFAA